MMAPDSMNMPETEGRTRRFHTRSRTGCSTCRKRHIRCDERRPLCTNCLTGRKVCEYPPVEPSLRERRAHGKMARLPGEQSPWVVAPTQLGQGPLLLTARSGVDPFNALPIDMPYQSKELFHYFNQVGQDASLLSGDKRDDIAATVVFDPNALRSTLLIAGVHYSWNSGQLKACEPTFLYHKVESIRLINQWLSKPQAETATTCVRQIATLCLAEYCLGNVGSSKLHLDGLQTFLDLQEKGYNGSHDGTHEDDLDIELTERYLLVVTYFIYGVKSRLGGLAPPRPAEAFSRMLDGHKSQFGGFESRLDGFRTLPYFFSPPPPSARGRRPRDVEALPFIRPIRGITALLDGTAKAAPSRRSSRATQASSTSEVPPPEPPKEVWEDAGPRKLFDAYVYWHRRSFEDDEGDGQGQGQQDDSAKKQEEKTPEQQLTSSWSGIAGISGLYVHSVIALFNKGQPMQRRILRRVLLMLWRDIERGKQEMTAPTPPPAAQDAPTSSSAPAAPPPLQRDLWFWKVFVAAFALDVSQRDMAYADYCDYGLPNPGFTPAELDASLLELQHRLDDCIRAWGETLGVTRWADAKAVLGRIAWPAVFPQEKHAEELWERAVGGGVRGCGV